MAGKAKAAGMACVVAAVTLLLVPTAYGQGKKGSHAAPSTEVKPKIDEKAYKAALDRIPTPKKPYDPWDQVHSSEPAKPAGKTN
jgi:hypothetical protein